MGLIFYLSSRPGNPLLDLGSLDFPIKKIAHIIEYALLYFLLFRTVNSFTSTRTSFILAAVIAILYAISDEYHQTFVPLREGRARDVVIDSFGMFLMYLYLKYRSRPSR